MKTFNQETIRSFSFPDFEIEKIQFSFDKREIKIFIEGAWLNMGQGVQLGKGILYFNNWEKFLINRFDPYKEQWIHLNKSVIESLQDICDLKFSDSTVYLYGFGKETGQWLQWKFKKTEIHAEFEI